MPAAAVAGDVLLGAEERGRVAALLALIAPWRLEGEGGPAEAGGISDDATVAAAEAALRAAVDTLVIPPPLLPSPPPPPVASGGAAPSASPPPPLDAASEVGFDALCLGLSLAPISER